MNCANCSSPALYVYDPPGVRSTAYCDRHLPSFLRPMAESGAITKAPAFDDAIDRALAGMTRTRKRRKPAPVEEPETPTEETPAEAPETPDETPDE